MATPDNYFQKEMSPQDLLDRIRAVIEGAELIRKEVNRIRNTANAMRVPLSRELKANLSHLQIDLTHLRVELGYTLGLQGEEFQQMLRQLENPLAILSNEDPT